MKKFLFLLLFLIPFSSFAWTEDDVFCVSGFGSDRVNGEYVYSDIDPTFSTKRYRLGTTDNYIIYNPGDPSVYLSSGDRSSFRGYYVYPGDYPTDTPWVVWVDGVTPFGTVTSGACSSGEPEVNIDPFKIYATSTCSGDVCVNDVSPIVGNISFLLVIIITLLFLVVAGFLFNTLTDKARKPWKR